MDIPLLISLLIMFAVFANASENAEEKEQKPLGCFDTIPVGDCEFMRQNKFCKIDMDKLKTKCDKTCRWCSAGKKCVDRAKYLNCSALTTEDCNTNVTFYISRCKKSCNWCGTEVWGPWSEWSKCPAGCGDQSSVRSRRCFTKSCEGEASESRPCLDGCPAWKDWSQWTPCSASCDRGERIRRRDCARGRECQGPPIQLEFCGMEPCSSDWKPWGEWSVCSDSCGSGFNVRTRICSIDKCVGDTREIGQCFLTECPSWTEWSGWTSCSVTCEKGEKTRTRNCKNGPGCDGDAVEKMKCELPSCTGVGPKFGEWTLCSRSCGSGTKIMLVECPEMDVNICPKVYKDCNTFGCPFKRCRDYRYEGRRSRYSACCENKPGTCGKNHYQLSSLKDRVIGGDVSVPKQFPWMARLEIMRNPESSLTEHFCGGTLIHPKYVATAAHCLESVRDAERLVVIFGAISRADASTYVQRIPVANFTLHPGYKYRQIPNDIALIELKTPVVITDYVRTICLPRGEITPQDEKCFVAGWGLRHYLQTTSAPNLMEARIRQLPFDFCKNAYKSASRLMDESHMMCAGRVGGKIDTCEGDSGGPLMCQRCSRCSWYLAGITSFGAEVCGSANTTGVYTRVNFFEDWLATKVQPTETDQYACPV